MNPNPPTTPAVLASQRHASLSRRRFLRGAGVSLALPAFDAARPEHQIDAG